MAIKKTKNEINLEEKKESFKKIYFQILHVFINRNKINKIICTCDHSNYTIEDVDSILKNPRERINVNNAFFLNEIADYDNAKEIAEIENCYKTTLKLLENHLTSYKEKFKDSYILNGIMSDSFVVLDAEIKKLQFNNWLVKNDVANKNQSLYLQVGIEKEIKSYTNLQLDFTLIKSYIDDAFDIRKIYLDNIKKDLLFDQFNYNLPSQNNLPIIKRDASLADICILIEGFTFLINKDDNKIFKEIMIRLFDIDDKIFTTSISEYRSKKENSNDIKRLIVTLTKNKNLER
jgi:hypothetical protein